MQFFKRYQAQLQAAAIFVGALFVFLLLWLLQVRHFQQNRMTLFLHTSLEGQTNPGATLLTQTFSSDSAFITMGLAPAPQDENAGVLTVPGVPPALAVYDGAGHLLGQAVASTAVLADENAPLNGYYIFEFKEEIASADGSYKLALTPNGASFGRSLRTPAGSEYFRDGKRQAGGLGLAVSTAPIGGFVGRFFGVFALVASLALAGLFFALRTGLPLHRLFAITAGTLGLLYCFALPPYSAPDEQFHINQTFNISSAMLGQAPWQVPWGSNFRRASDTDTLVEDFNTTGFTYQRHARDLFTRAADSTPTKFKGEEVGGYRLIYWPAALVVSGCRLLGLGFVPTLYAGRLVNLFLYIFLCTKAVQLAPFGKRIFALVPLLPMSLHLAASFSRDCLTIGLYLFYLSLCLHYTFVKPQLRGRDIGLLFAISFLAAPAKAVYAPLLLLCLTIPPQKLAVKGRVLAKKAAYAMLALVVCVGAVSFAWQGGGAIVQEAATRTPVPVVLRQTGGGTSSAGGTGTAAGGNVVEAPTALELAEAGFNPDGITYSFADFFQRPFTILQLFLRTLAENTTFYLQTMLGGSLSYFNLPISWVFILLLVLLLAAASIPPPRELRPKPVWQLFAGFLALSAVGLVFVGCITWTPTYYNTIYGVQGRYFLPALPLALCAAAPLWRSLKNTRDLSRPLVFAGAALSVCVLANAVLVVLAR